MGWWPFSSSGADAQAQQKHTEQPTSIPSISTQPTETQLQQAELSQSTTPPRPNEAPHDPDFYAAHPHLAPPSLLTPTTTPTSTTSDPSSSQPTTSSDAPDLDPHLPITMSCRAAFDSAFYCSSLGGHFNDIYRYGQLRNCSEHWSDFWFCMRTKNSYSPTETKQRIIQERYREKEQKLKAGPSSEDFWRVRGPGEQVKNAFGVGTEQDRNVEEK